MALAMLEERQGPVRMVEFADAGIDPRAVRELVQDKTILNPYRGVYLLPGHYEPRLLALSILAVRDVDYLLCLESAAEHHGLVETSNRNLWIAMSETSSIKPVAGFRPITVLWQGMQLPGTSAGALDMPAGAGANDVSTEVEQFYGVIREVIYGVLVKVTSPARTVCDLLRFMNRPVGRHAYNGLTVSEQTALRALSAYVESYEIDEAREMAERLGCEEEVMRYLSIADTVSSRLGRR